MQIAFLTLFLGLVSGTQDVALRLVGMPAVVELELDGRTVARLTAPPWRTAIDLGPLRPHELVAIARDEAGAELARTRQWLNLPRPAVEAQILLDRDADGRRIEAQLIWQGLTAAPPVELGMTLDGEPLRLAMAGPGSARAMLGTLGTLDLALPHLLSAELRFENDVMARRDLAFGGDLGDETQSDLTAVALRVDATASGKTTARTRGRAEAARSGAVDSRGRGWLVAAGRSLAPIAVDTGGADVVVVRDLSAREALDRYGARRQGPSREGLPTFRPGGLGQRVSSAEDTLRFEARLERDARLRFNWPTAKSEASGQIPTVLFDTSRTIPAEEAGLAWLLAHVEHPAASGGPVAGQRFTDAVAVAGLMAAAGGRPRAVVLVLGDATADASQYTVAEVRGYLAALRVPLHVWSLARPEKPAKNDNAPSFEIVAPPAWPEAVDVSSLSKLRNAVEVLKRDLASQVIVWVEGSHLPTRIELTPAAIQTGVRFAGTPSP